LISSSFMISVNVKLCFKREIVIRDVVILVALHMLKERLDLHFLQRDDNFVRNIPVWLEGGIRKRIQIGKALFDSCKKAMFFT
jgi:hypothetical protein